ncbi:MAG: adenine deaminase [Nocardioidaceae bacterium]|nr:adenine deaminase [Nocardioidaceae bacterium]
MRSRARLIAVARGDQPPDLVVAGAYVFSAFTKEWIETDVAVADGRIAGLGQFDGGERIDASGLYLAPGFIDAHMHIESSKLMVDEFVRAVLPHGTTAVVTDPHEIANVLGTDGIHWLLDVCEGLPVEIFVMASSCVPASDFESPRRALTTGDMESILRRSHALGVAEMMNYPGVIAGDEAQLDKLEVKGATHIDGHAPGVRGRALDAYLAAGIRSDHESTTYEEALEKRRKGMWVLIREASNARNLEALVPLVKNFGPDFCAFCTDDREPDFLVREGHINQMARAAVQQGLSAEDAILLSSLHPALYHGLEDSGAIAPGFKADFLLLEGLESFRPLSVFKAGRLVAEGGRALPFPAADVPLWVRHSVRLPSVSPESFTISVSKPRMRVIEIIPGQLLTNCVVRRPHGNGGRALADPENDLAKIAVIERHHATGRIGLGFVEGFGLKRGAFASTVAHDAHNVVVVGMNDHDMALCALRLQAMGGGIVVVADNQVLAELPLAVAGLLSEEPFETVVEKLDAAHLALASLGVEIESPFMTLSFLALSVIPKLKITDRGLVDVDEFALVPLELD